MRSEGCKDRIGDGGSEIEEEMAILSISSGEDETWQIDLEEGLEGEGEI